MQESIHKTDALASFYSDQSSFLFSLDMIKEGQRTNALCKFNSSLLSNKEFDGNIKNHIATTTIFLNKENIVDDQIKWEYLKYEIRKLAIQFSVSEANNRNKEIKTLENILSILKRI